MIINYYSIFRKEDSASEFIPLDIVSAAGNLEYTDTTALPGRLYYYAVHGCRTNVLTDKQGLTANYYGAYIPLGSVTDLTISNIGANSATLSWGAVKGAQSYIIKQYDSSKSTYVEVDRVDSGITSYVLTGLSPLKQYNVKVVAYTDYYKEGYGTNKMFTTSDADPAPADIFTITGNNKTYTGSGQGVTVSCSVEEITNAGWTVYYKKSGTSSSFSTTLPVDAGTYQIQIKTAASAGYSATTLTDDSWILTIAPKSITPAVTLSKDSYAYTGSECKPAVTVTTGDTSLTINTDYTVSYSDNINVGTAGVTVSPVSSGSNYTFTAVTKNFTISKATTTVTISGGNKTVTYGDAGFTLSATAALPGSGSGSFTWSSDKTAVATVNASTGAVTIKGAGEATITAVYSSNDTSGSASIKLTVKKAELSVTANDKTITYGDAPSDAGVTYSGFVGVDNESVIKGDVSFSCSYTQYSNKGNYVITPAGLDADNYVITYVAGILTVEPKAVGLNWTGTVLTYNGEVQHPEATATGLVNGDTCTVTVTGAKTGAGTYTATASGLSNTNYELPVTKTVSYTIKKASVADKTAAASVKYGNSGELDLSAYVIAGGSLKTSGISVSDTNTIISGSPSIEGSKLKYAAVDENAKVGDTATITVGVDGGDNYEDYSIAVTLTVIDKMSQTVTFTGITDGKIVKTYGDAAFTVTATATGAVTYTSSDTSVATVNASSGQVQILKAGEVIITATAAATDDLAMGSADCILTIGKKEIGINWSNISFTYDKTAHKPTATATGLKTGDSCSLSVGGEKINAGTYTATVTGLGNENYKLPANVTGEYTINKKPVIVSGITVTAKEYDGTLSAEVDCSTAEFSGLETGDSLTVTATGVYTDANAGTDKNVDISITALGGTSIANYILAANGQQDSAKGVITAKPLTITAGSATTPYDGTPLTKNSYSSTGLAEGDQISSVNIIGSQTSVGSSANNASAAKIVNAAGKDKTANYDISYADGELIVTAAESNAVTVDIEGWTYGDEPNEPTSTAAFGTATYTYSNAMNGTFTDTVPVNAGTWYVKATVEETSEYSGGSAVKDFVIAKKNLTVTADAKSKIYGSADPALTYTVSGLVGTDTITVTLNRAAGENAGTYEITKTSAVTGDNYTISYTGALFTITKAVLTVTANANTITYGDAPAGNGVVYSGFINGETEDVLDGELAYTYSYSRYGNVGDTYTITAKGLTSANYSFDYVPGKLTVTQKEVGVSWDTTPLEYNGMAQSPAATATGLVNNDAVTVTVSGTGTDAGTGYIATATGLSGAKAPNYKLAGESSTEFEIIKAKIDPKVSLENWVVGTTANTPVVSGNSGNGTVTFVYKIKDADDNTYEANVPTAVGKYTIKASIEETDNYLSGEATADFEIIKTPAVIATAPTARTLTYNGTEQALVEPGTATGGSIVYSLSSNGTCVTDIPTGKDAGTYTVFYKALADNNHSDSATGNVEVLIAKAAASVTADDKSKVYGEADPELTATVSGNFGSDVVAYALSREDGEEVGTYKITASGNAAQDNYNVNYIAGTFTISANTITPSVSLSQVSYVYDGEEKTPGVYVRTGETLLEASEYSVEYASNINAGTAEATVSSNGVHYSFDPITVHFTIEKAPIEPVVTIEDWVAGESASVPSVSGNLGNGEVTYKYKVKDAADSTYKAAVPQKKGSYTVMASITETDNYLAGSATADFNILGKDVVITDVPVAKSGLVYNGEPQELISAGTVSGGSLLYALGEDDITAPSNGWSESIPTGTNAGTYYVWYKVNTEDPDADNTPACITVVIDKAKQEAPEAPVMESVSTNVITLVAYEGYEYKCAEGQWQSSNVFSGLEAGTGYSFFQRKAEDENHYASESSKAAVISTEEAVPEPEPVAPAELKFVFENGVESCSVNYTGSAVKPKVVGIFGDDILAEGVDYKVTYSKNVNAGTGYAKVSGMGTYEGNHILSFSILPAPLSDEKGEPAEGVVIGGLTVQGNAKAVPVLFFNSIKVSSDQYSTDLSPDDTVTIKAVAGGNFTGSITGLKINRINDKQEYKKSKIVVKLDKVSRTYNGEPQLLGDELKVTDKNGNKLTEGIDYVISYSADTINAGKVKVKIIAIGDHTGTVDKSYKIAPAANATISISLVQEEGQKIDTYSYVKAGVTPPVNVTALISGKTHVLEEGRDYKVSYSNNNKVGTLGKVKLKMLGNYKGAKAGEKTFAIHKAVLSNAEVFVGDMIYKKEGAYRAKPVVTIDGELVAESEYTVSYTINGKPMPKKYSLAPGVYEKTVTVTINAKGRNFENGAEALTATYRILMEGSKTDISKAKVRLVEKNGSKQVSKVRYTGSSITFDPADAYRQADICVKIGKKITIKGSDVYKYFDVSYVDNVLKGKATIVITAKEVLDDGSENPYKGMSKGKFTITKKKIQ